MNLQIKLIIIFLTLFQGDFICNKKSSFLEKSQLFKKKEQKKETSSQFFFLNRLALDRKNPAYSRLGVL